jgi:hypothetical protein
MKKLILSFFIIVLSAAAFAQTGLDGIIVERYYLTNATDAAADPNLRANSVTYRIYADLRTGWRLQEIFASGEYDNNQPMQFSTTTSFYNSPVGNSAWGEEISYSSILSNGLLMLDSYLTWGVGAASSGGNHYWGRLKADDDAANQIAVAGGLLQNTDAFMGIPVNQRDGYMTSATAPVLPNVKLGFDGLVAMLNGTNPGNAWTSDPVNGALIINSTNQGILGADPENRILIGQFTTDGEFSFQINLKIRSASGTNETLVASNPAGAGEFLVAGLSQTLTPPAPPTPPTVTNLTVTPGSVILGQVVNLSVEATDAAPGSISQVEFFRGTTSIGVSASLSSPYELAWTSDAIGNFNITAVARDNEGTPTTSSIVPLVVLPVPANNPPVVETLSVNPTGNINFGASIAISATASDSDGTVQSVEFFVGGTSVFVDNSLPYEYTATAPSVEGPLTITARATDNGGAPSADRSVIVNIVNPDGAPYRVLSQTVSCVGSDLFYVPVITRPGAAPLANIIGFDLVMKYDMSKVRPTGVIKVDGSLITDPTWSSYALRQAGDSLIISLFLNAKAPANTFFHGSGNVMMVEFTKLPIFLPNDNATFTVPSLVESYNTGIITKLVDAGAFTTFAEHIFKGKLLYWADASPIYYELPGNSLITNIHGNVNPAIMVQPDAFGMFDYDIVNGTRISIERLIDDASDVMVVVNGYDAFLTQKVVLEDPSFRPNVFQIMAMDVNRDGKISAGDVSQILQRAALMIGEFRQQWNYNDDGSKKTGMGASYDWVFADNSGLYGDPRRFGIYPYASATISSTYPKDDGRGFSKSRATAWPANNLELPIEGTSCPIIYSEEYQGVMYGDVDGSYKNLAKYARPDLKGSLKEGNSKSAAETTGAKVLFDLSKAGLSDDYFVFPVAISSANNVNSLDFAMNFDRSKLRFKDVTVHTDGAEFAAHFNEIDQTLRFSSYSMTSYRQDAPVALVRFEVINKSLSQEDISVGAAYLNGDPVVVETTEMTLNELIDKIKIYPNPAREIVYIEFPEGGSVSVYDGNGRILNEIPNLSGNTRHAIDVSNLARGAYEAKIKYGQYIVIKKIIVTK